MSATHERQNFTATTQALQNPVEYVLTPADTLDPCDSM